MKIALFLTIAVLGGALFPASGQTVSASYASGTSTAEAATASSSPIAPTGALEQVVVTAQKEEQHLLDVPVPVTAISATNLVESNQVRLQDYFATIPGLNFTTDPNGAPILSIRGLTTGFGSGNPTTSIAIDGVPYGSSSGYGGSFALLPDIDPSDLVRVEVLRGPQGTLYGASSLGGLINYVTAEPSTTRLSGRVEADLSAVHNGNRAGYATRGAANVPIGDSVALRISGFVRETPGYIDDVATEQRAVNRVDAEGGHLALLIRPSDLWSLKLSALFQNNESHGLGYADPGLGDLKQDTMPNTGKYHSKAEAYSAIFKVKFGVAELTALTGYNVNSMHDRLDITNDFGFLASADFGVGGSAETDHQKISKFSQEVRLSTSIGGRVDWLLGLFYTYEKANGHQQWWAADLNTGAILPTGNILDGVWPTTYAEYAAFTDITVHFTDKFDVQFGGRESENRQTYSEIDGGGYTTVFGFPQAPAPLVTPEVNTKDNAFTYLVTPRYKLSQHAMVYARVATGYRPGGPNATCSAFDLPCHFGPDRTQDYEIGMKGDVLDHRLDFDASIFYIDWKHIQIGTYPPCQCATVFLNAGGAKSQGLELALQGRPTDSLTLSGWVDYTDAVLTAAFPTGALAVGNTGDRLPFSSKVSGNFSAEQDFPLSDSSTLFAAGSVSYVGNRLGNFEGQPLRSYYPAYAETNLRIGMLVKDWRLTAFANNIGDKRGVLGGTLPIPYFGNGYAYIQPRTIGLSAAKTF